MDRGKGHFTISLIKSAIRLGGSLTGFIFVQDGWVKGAFAALFIAEILGIIEELVDKRI
jgi:hypothetical protein